jgi:hypothetical protein
MEASSEALRSHGYLGVVSWRWVVPQNNGMKLTARGASVEARQLIPGWSQVNDATFRP